MDEPQDGQSRDASGGFGKSPPGLLLPIVCLVVWPIVFWSSYRTPCSNPLQSAVVSLAVVSMVWTAVCMIQVDRRVRKMGWRRSHFTRLIMGSRPSDPEELVIWLWVRQNYYGLVTIALCVLALYFMSEISGA